MTRLLPLLALAALVTTGCLGDPGRLDPATLNGAKLAFHANEGRMRVESPSESLWRWDNLTIYPNATLVATLVHATGERESAATNETSRLRFHGDMLPGDELTLCAPGRSASPVTLQLLTRAASDAPVASLSYTYPSLPPCSG